VSAEGSSGPVQYAALLDRWRQHLDILGIVCVWAPPSHLVDFVADAAGVAHTLGLSRVLSPLVPESALQPYRAIGMTVLERVATYRGVPSQVRGAEPPEGIEIRLATASDVAHIAEVDSACFFDLWRFGVPEITQSVRDGWVMVAEDEQGVAGYASLLVNREIATLGRLGVAPRARRRGIGGALLSAIATLAATMGATEITICTQMSNQEARLLYRKAGLTEVPEPYALAVTNVRQTR
jgi:ribosomal-protein-alanine N-acetyltransferase